MALPSTASVTSASASNLTSASVVSGRCAKAIHILLATAAADLGDELLDVEARRADGVTDRRQRLEIVDGEGGGGQRPVERFDAGLLRHAARQAQADLDLDALD